MRFLGGLKVRKKIVDSKDWLSSDYNVEGERAAMTKQLRARKKAKAKLEELRLLKEMDDWS